MHSTPRRQQRRAPWPRAIPSRTAKTRTNVGKGEGDHVCISSERDTPPRASALGPSPGSKTSWRDTPRYTVTREIGGWILLGAALLVCLGLLLGWAWTTQALQPKLGKQAEERRRLNEEWQAVRTARRQQGECPRCASPLSEQDWYYAPILVEDPPDDD